MTSVLFVCTGNICRSPTAEGVFTHLVGATGLSDRIAADSAGTMDFNIGSPPDATAQQVARLRGFDLSSLRARRLRSRDFDAFDYLLGMDLEHLHVLRGACPPPLRDRLHLFLDFARMGPRREVPDPYGGTVDEFEAVLDLVEAGTRGLLEHIRSHDL